MKGKKGNDLYYKSVYDFFYHQIKKRCQEFNLFVLPYLPQKIDFDKENPMLDPKFKVNNLTKLIDNEKQVKQKRIRFKAYDITYMPIIVSV